MLGPLHINIRFYYGLLAVIVVFALSHTFVYLFVVGIALLVLLLALTVVDYYMLHQLAKQVFAEREVGSQLSLGDTQQVAYKVSNGNKEEIYYQLYDELPSQLQIRNDIGSGTLSAGSSQLFDYDIRPTERGSYIFDKLHVMLKSKRFGLVMYKKTVDEKQVVAVIPSTIQMKKYALQVFSKTATLSGVRRIRSIGENDEFEHLKSYNQGDNIKSINWKATSRRNELIVNQYQNTRSQNVYCIIDKGRSMKMPFDKLTLLDYAINSCLSLSNIILRKHDNAGLITFSDKIGTLLSAKGMKSQLQVIAKELHDQKTEYLEPNFELLLHTTRKSINRRSIILLFTNFEQPIDLDRNLPFLKSISKRHLLVVIFFTNDEISRAANLPATSKRLLYQKTFAEMAVIQKEEIRDKLRLHGIETILTSPSNLTIDVINKYLEIKAKRMR